MRGRLRTHIPLYAKLESHRIITREYRTYPLRNRHRYRKLITNMLAIRIYQVDHQDWDSFAGL